MTRHRVSLRAATMLLAGTLIVAACGGGSSAPDTTAGSTTTAAPTPGEPVIAWRECEDDAALDCGTIFVPYDHDDPDRGLFTLQLVRRPANDPAGRIGPMLVNPGGPGFGGTYLAREATSYFGQDVLDRFDIVGWDPRGTGRSSPAVDCIDDYDAHFSVDISPDDASERIALREANRSFAESCGVRSAEILPWVSTNASARDIDWIRRALGVERITYFGFSYGSELGATWATMFPGTVRAAVLDGATDPTLGAAQAALGQARGFEAQLTAFLQDCATRGCTFATGGDPFAAYDRIISRLDSRPLSTTTGRPALNQSRAYFGVATALYSASRWRDLADALDEARRGSGAALLALHDTYFQRRPDGSWGNELDAFTAIGCLDTDFARDPDAYESLEPQLRSAAPRMWPLFAHATQCAYWTADPDPRIAITGAGAGTIVVIATTGDAATPLAGTRAMAAALEDGRLVIVEADRHTGYGVNDCVVSTVDEYVLTAGAAFTEKRC